MRDFREHLDKSHPNGLSEAVVAIKTLLQLIKDSEGDIFLHSCVYNKYRCKMLLMGAWDTVKCNVLEVPKNAFWSPYTAINYLNLFYASWYDSWPSG